MIKVFIGYDIREKAAFSVLAHSILKYATLPVSIVPLKLENLKTVFTRERVENQSTDFAFSRFIVPHLCDYKGWALFCDCDQLFRTDIAELWNLRDPKYAVQVCKHDYTPKTTKKFLGAIQEPYLKKNWSSVMLFNCEKCTALTPDYVNSATGLQLHQFKWLDNDELIGDIPLEWNWLVGEYEYNEKAKNVHYTLGGPYFKKYRACDYAKDWYTEYSESTEINLEE